MQLSEPYINNSLLTGCGKLILAGITMVILMIPYCGFAQKIKMTEQISIKDGQNQVELKWQGTTDWYVTHVEYRVFGATEWEKSDVGKDGFSIKVNDLAEDMAYQWRLIFKDGGDTKTGPTQVFRTYALVLDAAAENDFNTKKATLRQKATIHQLYADRLQFSYQDDYRLSEYLKGEIMDEKGIVLSKVAFSANIDGLYLINLTALKVNWKLDEVYHLRVSDQFNPKRSVFFQIGEPSEEPIEARIIVNPIYVDCTEQASSLIEYYGEFNGGLAPYLVTWSVASAGNFTTPLAKPKATKVMNSSSIPLLKMDYPLPYLVVMTAEDGCGNFGEYAILVRCQKNEDGESSILFERVEYDRRNNRYWPE